jgi:ribosomal protein S18 acetylase RimI-like enzyme
MRIRPATEPDFVGLCRLWAEVDRLHAELQPGFFLQPPEPPRDRRALQRQLRAEDQITLVAESDAGGGLLGLAAARLVDTPAQPQLRPCRRLYVEELVVGSRWQGMGVGSALLEAAEGWGRQRGARQTLLTVWEGNREAQAFYSRHGFVPVNQVLGRPL